MLVDSCIPVIPSADLEKTLRFWVDGLGLSMDRAMRQDVASSDAWFITSGCISGSINELVLRSSLRIIRAYDCTGRRATSRRSESAFHNLVTQFRRSWIAT